ncbi:MAG: hypothetical protein RBS57_07725 [Desulforhabdus sp.]|nr:hypothetical protein [Desulforhabdus sp.]
MKLHIYNYNRYKIVMIRASAVATHFDQRDLACRQNSDKKFEIKYHENWIHRDLFCVPSFYMRNGKAFVGIGRHRFKLLSKFLPEFPAGFEGFKGFEGKYKIESKKVYDKIVIRDLDPDELFEFPDLPIENLGDDCNGRPIWKDDIK